MRSIHITLVVLAIVASSFANLVGGETSYAAENAVGSPTKAGNNSVSPDKTHNSSKKTDSNCDDPFIGPDGKYSFELKEQYRKCGKYGGAFCEGLPCQSR
jgi:hypothetical protein